MAAKKKPEPTDKQKTSQKEVDAMKKAYLDAHTAYEAKKTALEQDLESKLESEKSSIDDAAKPLVAWLAGLGSGVETQIGPHRYHVAKLDGVLTLRQSRPRATV